MASLSTDEPYHVVVEAKDYPNNTIVGDCILLVIPCEDDEFVSQPYSWTLVRRVDGGVAFSHIVTASDPPTHTFTVYREVPEAPPAGTPEDAASSGDQERAERSL